MRKLWITLCGVCAICSTMAQEPFEAPVITEEKPVLRIGVIADCQYYDGPNQGTRHYRESLHKLEEAVSFFNKENLDFVISLGDLIDRDLESFDAPLAILKNSNAPVYHVTGNHDFSVGEGNIAKAMKKLNLNPKRRYYDFAQANYRFIILDGSDISLFGNEAGTKKYLESETLYESLRSASKNNAQTWNGAVGTKQLHWLEKKLQQATKRGERVIVFSHYPILPYEWSATLWNREEVQKMLRLYSCVVAHLNSHEHTGGKVISGLVLYYTFRGMVEGSGNRFAILELFDNSLKITGQGEQPDEYFPYPLLTK